MKTIPFVTVDVFTTERFAGNPLAVITDARGLSDQEMQQIATEFGYSETSFVLPPRDPENTAEVRIFTPVTEIPFAGHPNVGTAYVIANMETLFGRAVDDQLRFEEKGGLVDVMISRNPDGSLAGATIRAPGPLYIGAVIDPAIMAPCINLHPEQINTNHHNPVFASVGLKFILIEVSDIDALSQAASRLEPLEALRTRYASEDCDCATFLYTWIGENHVRARMFAPFDNVIEDPATGSASAALAAFLTTLPSGKDRTKLLVEQGVEMGRRSLIELDVRMFSGAVDHVTIKGSSVEIMKGTLSV
ncbi:PhzF family phenazine biosynthesis protein [Peteryoungia desertarenae]|uniref:PhzF family phenazine biosynthesis protein n=1 Tax=Peteryoungia desertarenae TaxID=1813451 RepID=A0ABX6QIG1_9HYPH|nr:PhzF family phenazine biosynthesis protein [Peteryoungia desertarenae]QLF68072.1 PhzF family phenazine biosynthesis protein [Peteryoungia desertarenae]